MSYQYEYIRDNGDATSSYEVIGGYPVLCSEFIEQIIKQEDSFRVVFNAYNQCYGGWLGDNRIEFHKHNNTWHCIRPDDNRRLEPTDWISKFINKNVLSCWASGGWGQMTYHCTFEEGE